MIIQVALISKTLIFLLGNKHIKNLCTAINGLVILKKKENLITCKHRKILSSVVYSQKTQQVSIACTLTFTKVKNKWTSHKKVFSDSNKWSITWVI